MRKYSRKREAILKTIQSTTCHPSADWVYNQLRSQFPDLSLATVYRNIAMFKDEGTIVSVGVIDGEERYDGDITHHPHFICQQCGAVVDIDFDDDLQMNQAVEEQYGCQVHRYNLVFHGICSQCLAGE